MTRLALLVCLLCCGCTGSLGEAKSVAMGRKYGGVLTEVPSAECQRLDRKHQDYADAATVLFVLGGGVAAGTAAMMAADPDDIKHRDQVAAGMGIGSAVLAGAGEAAQQVSDAAKTEWAEKCSIIGGAK